MEQLESLIIHPNVSNRDKPAEAEMMADWMQASMSSLRDVWDNEEDVAYEHLIESHAVSLLNCCTHRTFMFEMEKSR